jgi:ABC-type transporter Mla MlaB component
MKVAISGSMAHLGGNWTRTEMTDRNIDSLAVSLQQLKVTGMKSLQIDCGELKEVDASGLQLLYIWLRFFRFRGVEVEIVNLPEKFRKTMLRLMQKICYPEKAPGLTETHGANTIH